jgi:hypothetical protein
MMTGEKPLPDGGGSGRWSVLPALLFLAAVAAMAPQIASGRLGDGFEQVTIARNLAAHGAFANPYSWHLTGATAHMAPLHPLFLALVIYLFGISATSALVVCCCGVVAQGLEMALLPFVSNLLFGSRWPGIAGACLGIVLPIFKLLPHCEYVYCAVGLMLFSLTTGKLARRTGALPGLACGVFLGLLVLLNPASLPVAACWLGYLFWRKRLAEPKKFALVLALSFGLVQAPWMWRNYRVLHTFVFVRDNMGLELAVSNNDQAGASFRWNTDHGVYFPLHPCCSAQQAEHLRAIGEGRYVHERMAEALRWIGSHPARFLSLTLARCRLFWFPSVEENPPGFAVSIAFLTIASWLALLLLAHGREAVGVFPAAVFLLYPLVYYVVEFDDRYRISILWIFLLESGYLLCAVEARVAKYLRARRGTTRETMHADTPASC